ncbi:MAG TPA: hypothetical protein VN665_02015 [Candidatus Paceibacterota bacterium]|nr:hypothetical protein [Candidatus Paceibacterota bacterium]
MTTLVENNMSDDHLPEKEKASLFIMCCGLVLLVGCLAFFVLNWH